MLGTIVRSAGLALVLAARVSAQTTLTPFGGRIFPQRSMIIDTAGGGYFRMLQQTVYGLQVSRTVAPGIAVELVGGIGSGTMEVVEGATELALGTSIYFADLRGRLKIVGTDAAQLSVVGGAGWTQYSMGLFEAAHATTDSTKLKGTVTGIVGLAFRGKVSERFALTADLTDRLHAQPITGANFGSNPIHQSQNDLAFNLGLSFPLDK